MVQIRNKEQLIQNAETEFLLKARTLALNCLQAALDASDPKRLLSSKLKVENSLLLVEGHSFDLENFDHIYVVGGGKASGSMAEALEALLNGRISSGVVNVPNGDHSETSIIELNEASHPIPNEAGVTGANKMMELARKSGENDLIICLISGGGSSLMPLPRGVSLSEKKLLTSDLMKSGAAINELNVVRKHLSSFKGGWLAKEAYPATVLNLLISDVVGDTLDLIASGPTVPDSSTFTEAMEILKKYRLTARHAQISKAILQGANGLISETPKPGDPAFDKVFNIIIGSNRVALKAACESLSLEGLNTLLLADVLSGEAREAGEALALFAKNLKVTKNSIPVPAGIVAGGETTVTVSGKGIGGRNQEMALAGSLYLSDVENCVLASMGTDGVDGPTEAAGAIVDNLTCQRGKSFGLDQKESLDENDSFSFFSQLNDLILTGPTGTNVN